MAKLGAGTASAPAEPATKATATTTRTKATSAAEAQPELWLETVGLADQADTVNVLYYGESGSGKTSSLATMANLGPVLFINAEAGVKRQPLQRLGVNIDNIRLLPRPNQDLTFELLEDTFWKIRQQLDDDPGAYAGVVWDSLTEIHKKVLDNIVAHQASKAERSGKERDRFFIDRADWGVMSEQMRLLLRRYRDLPCHFGMSALTRRETDDDGRVVYRPGVTPALQADVVGFMDVVCFTSVETVDDEEEFQGLFRPIGKYRGKDRFGVTPRRLVDPTFERLAAYISGDLDVENDPVMEQARLRRAQEAAPPPTDGGDEAKSAD